MHQVRTCRKHSLVFSYEKRGDARLARWRLIHTWLFMRTRENRGCASNAQVNKHIPPTTLGEKGRAPRITRATLPKSTQKCYSFSTACSRGVVPSPRFRVSVRSCGFGAPSSVVLLVMQPNKSVRRSILRLTSCLSREILKKANQSGKRRIQRGTLSRRLNAPRSQQKAETEPSTMKVLSISGVLPRKTPTPFLHCTYLSPCSALALLFHAMLHSIPLFSISTVTANLA